MSLSPGNRLAEVQRLIADRAFDGARHALARVECASDVDRRAAAHLGAVLRFYSGDIAAARRELERAARTYGDNVNLSRDLMICQYHLQEFDAFRASLTRLELTLLENEAQLSVRSLIESEVWLGKSMEEEARLAAAQVFFERARARLGDGDAELRLLVLIQLARWQGLYEPGDELSVLYRELISVPTARVNRSLRAELEHSLMLIELRLIGGDHAWTRVTRAQHELVELDQRLLVFDFVEGALGQDLPLGPEVLTRVNAFTTLDPYEAFLKRLITEAPSAATKIRDLTEIAPRITWSSHLRLLCLVANLEVNPSARGELNRKIQLIIGGLDPRSQDLWRKRLKRAFAAPELRVDLSLRTRTVTIHGQTLDLSKKKIGLQLLSGLLEKSQLSVDEAIERLWQTAFTPEHYHRLRMSTHRLNTLIHEGTGIGKLIEVDSQTVRLRPEVKLQRADAPDQ